MSTATTASVSNDRWLVAVGLLTAVASLVAAIATPPPPRTDDDTPIVAHVKQTSAALQLRPVKTLGWRPLTRGQDVHDADAIFVPPGAEGSLEFLDGTVLELDERTLVVVEPPRDGLRSVKLKQGSVSSRTGRAGLIVETTNGNTTLPPSAEARVELDRGSVKVAVKKGSARVATPSGPAKEVVAGARANIIEEALDLVPAWPVELAEPPAQFRQLFQGAPGAVTLSWAPAAPKGARVQLAADRLFSFVALERPIEQTTRFTIEKTKRGVTWWRVVDERGAPLSESRRFSLIEDIAPTPMFPQAAEVVLSLPGTRTLFSWASVPGVTAYRVELSASQSFDTIALREDVTGAQARLSLELDEGTWFWRVRAADDASLEGVPSAAVRFRLIHKAIPDAPELLTPVLEVTP